MSHLLSIRDLDGKHVLDIFKLTAEDKRDALKALVGREGVR